MIIGNHKEFLEKPVFEKRKTSWMSELPSVTEKKNNSTILNSMKMTQIEASREVKEKSLQFNFQYKGQKRKSNVN